MPNDVFGLNVVYDRQVESTWPESNVYGYFAGGNDGSNVCTIDRLDFSTETVSEPGSSLSVAKIRATGFNNSEYGYVAGGTDNSGVNCVIDRLDFSNETVSLPGTNLPLAKSYITNTTSQNLNSAYIGGGYGPHPNGPPAYQCIIERFDFSNEVVVSLGNKLTVARDSQCALSSKEYGYYAGGEGINPGSSPPSKSIIERLEFSNETVTVALYLPEGREKASPLYDENHGFICGGEQDTQAADNTYVTCTINRIDFSNDTLTNAESNLTHQRTTASSVQNSNHGYIGGGMSPSTSYLTSITRLDFSNNTVSIIEGTLEGRITATGFHSTKSKTHANQVKKGSDKDGKGISSTYGYFVGGFAPPNVCTIDRLDYSTETVAAPPTGQQLPDARNALTGLSNPNYGYFGGGSSPSTVATIDRIDFSNETFSAPGNNLSQARWGLTAVSNSNYGYFCGGTDYAGKVDRIDFINETISQPNNNLGQGSMEMGSLSLGTGKDTGGPSADFAYFAGGRNPLASPNKVNALLCMDYRTEVIGVPGDTLPEARDGLRGVSDYSNYGYFAAGNDGGVVFTVDRLDFSTTTITPSGNLPQARSQLASVSNSSYGYFGGGSIPSSVTTVDKIDFSTGTPGSAVGSLSQARYGHAAVSN